jgi:hypothetical protein
MEEQGRKYRVHIQPDGYVMTLCGLEAAYRITVPSSDQMAAGTCGTCLDREEQRAGRLGERMWRPGPSVAETQARYKELRAQFDAIPHGEGSPAHRLLDALKVADQMHVLHQQIMRAFSGSDEAMNTMTTVRA